MSIRDRFGKAAKIGDDGLVVSLGGEGKESEVGDAWERAKNVAATRGEVEIAGDDDSGNNGFQLGLGDRGGDIADENAARGRLKLGRSGFSGSSLREDSGLSFELETPANAPLGLLLRVGTENDLVKDRLHAQCDEEFQKVDLSSRQVDWVSALDHFVAALPSQAARS
jgi:hypothetical protein